MSSIQVDKEALVAKAKEISDLDVILDAQSGSKAAGKRAVTNGLIAESASSDFVNSVIAKLNDNFSGEELYGTYFSLLKALEDEIGEDADAFVDAKVEETSQEASEKLSDEEVKEISEDRKKKVGEFKALKGILEMFGEDVDDIPEPKIRRGSRGPRGPRTLSKFQYTVNETELDSEVNSLSTVAKLCGDMKVKDLKQFITDQGIDLKNPPANWEANLPNDVGTLYASVLPEYEADFSEEDDEEEAETPEPATV